jgi:hypothetical protein
MITRITLPPFQKKKTCRKNKTNPKKKNWLAG